MWGCRRRAGFPEAAPLPACASGPRATSRAQQSARRTPGRAGLDTAAAVHPPQTARTWHIFPKASLSTYCVPRAVSPAVSSLPLSEPPWVGAACPPLPSTPHPADSPAGGPWVPLSPTLSAALLGAFGLCLQASSPESPGSVLRELQAATGRREPPWVFGLLSEALGGAPGVSPEWTWPVCAEALASWDWFGVISGAPGPFSAHGLEARFPCVWEA